MKKNKKNKNEKVILNHEELVPTTIGTIEENNGGILGVILIICLFLVCIFLLPYVTQWYKDFTNNKEVITIPSNNKDKETVDNNSTNEKIYSKIESSLELTIDEYKFNNFLISNNKLSFKVIPNEKDTSYFNKHNYYIEIYDKDKKMLERIKFVNEVITKENSYTMNIDSLVSKDAYYITINEITDEMIPNVSLNNNSLTCKKNNNTITYAFTTKDKQEVLTNINVVLNVLDTDSNYESTLNKYTKIVDTSKSMDGILASLTPTLNGFNYEISINLNNAKESDIAKLTTEDYIYKKDSLAKVINFELEARSYKCE